MAYPTSLAAPQMIIRYKGLFDYDGLYNIMVQWLKARGFWFHERTYKHKVPSPLGAEQEIEWTAEKKVTDYYKFVYSIKWHLWDMTEVEVVKEGVKKVLTNARLEIKLKGVLEIDWKKRLGGSTFWTFVRDWYHKYIIRKDIETIWGDTMYYRLQRLHKLIKDFLDMEAKGYAYEGYLGDNV